MKVARTANVCNSKQCLSPSQQIWFKCHSSFSEIYTVPNCLTLSFKVIEYSVRHLLKYKRCIEGIQSHFYM